MTAEMVRARREELERAAQLLRKQLQIWNAEDAEVATWRERARAALFAAVNRRWTTRVEQVCMSIEAEIVRLRTEEHRLAVGPRRSWFATLLR